MQRMFQKQVEDHLDNLSDSSSINKYNSNSSSFCLFREFDWLEKKFYTLINSMSRNLGTIFFPQVPKLCNDVDKNKILMKKIGIIRNELYFCVLNLSICKLWRITHKLK